MLVEPRKLRLRQYARIEGQMLEADRFRAIAREVGKSGADLRPYFIKQNDDGD